MLKVAVTQNISAAQRDVWDAWANFGNIAKFHPAVEMSSIIGEQSTGNGARRRCNFYDKTMIEERVTIFNPISAIGWTLTIPPGPIKHGDALVELRARGDTETIVTFTLTFTMKMGPLGWLLGQLVVKNAMKNALRQLLQSLDDHLRTGKRVGKDGMLSAA